MAVSSCTPQCYAKIKLSLLFFKNPEMPLIPKNPKTLTSIFFFPAHSQLPVSISPFRAVPFQNSTSLGGLG